MARQQKRKTFSQCARTTRASTAQTRTLRRSPRLRASSSQKVETARPVSSKALKASGKLRRRREAGPKKACKPGHKSAKGTTAASDGAKETVVSHRWSEYNGYPTSGWNTSYHQELRIETENRLRTGRKVMFEDLTPADSEARLVLHVVN